MKLLAKLLESVRWRYREDRCKPGVVISAITCTEVYASIARYPNGPNGKVIVCKARAATLPGALRALAFAWLIEFQSLDSFQREAGLRAKDIDEALAEAIA